MAEIHFSPDEPVIVLDVTIKGPKGKRKIPSALDTGATFTIIPWDVAEVLGFKLDKELRNRILKKVLN